MNVFLIHGEDSDKSYQRLKKFVEEAKKRKWEINYLDESPYSLSENISSISLFSKERFLIHRDFSKVGKKDLGWLSKNSGKYEGNIVFYSESAIPRNLILRLPKSSKIEEFKLPKLIWKFLNSFYPGNSAEVVFLLHKIYGEQKIEFIFGLLSKQLRDLYAVKKGGLESYPAWRVAKLKNQASKFKSGSLEKIISEMADADIKSKTSQTNLIDLLDFIAVEGLA